MGSARDQRDRQVARECYKTFLKPRKMEALQLQMQAFGEQDFDEQQVDEIIIDADKPDGTVKIGVSLAPDV